MENLDHMKVSGSGISLMDLVCKYGKMGVNMKEIINLVKNKVKDNIFGLINLYIMGIG
jgi:hypothetical protein